MNDRLFTVIVATLGVVCSVSLFGAILIVLDGKEIPPFITGIAGTALGIIVSIVNFQILAEQVKRAIQERRTQPPVSGPAGETKPVTPAEREGSGRDRPAI